VLSQIKKYGDSALTAEQADSQGLVLLKEEGGYQYLVTKTFGQADQKTADSKLMKKPPSGSVVLAVLA
jgi:hypothetical protein